MPQIPEIPVKSSSASPASSAKKTEVLPEAPMGRRSFIQSGLMAVGALALRNNVIAATGKSVDVKWERDSRPRDVKETSPIVNYRFIEAPRTIARDALFGSSFVIVKPTPQIAEIYRLGSDYESQVFAWVGAPVDGSGKIVLMNLNTGKEFATVKVPGTNKGHSAGWGIKVSPDGRYLGIESAGDAAGVYDQIEKTVVMFEHPDFQRHLAKDDGTLKPINGNPIAGCRMEFVIYKGEVCAAVSGIKSETDRVSQPGDLWANIQLFNLKGEHLETIEPAGQKSEFMTRRGLCNQNTGPNLHYHQPTNTLYFSDWTLRDPEKPYGALTLLGRVGGYYMENLNSVKASIYRDTTQPRSIADKIPKDLSVRMAKIIGNKMFVGHSGLGNQFDPEAAGRITIHSLDKSDLAPLGTIEIGKMLGISVDVTAITALNDNNILVAYTQCFEENPVKYKEKANSQISLALCDLNNLTVKAIPNFTLSALGGIFVQELRGNPNYPNRVFIGLGRENKIIELELREDYLFPTPYTTVIGQE